MSFQTANLTNTALHNEIAHCDLVLNYDTTCLELEEMTKELKQAEVYEADQLAHFTKMCSSFGQKNQMSETELRHLNIKLFRARRYRCNLELEIRTRRDTLNTLRSQIERTQAMEEGAGKSLATLDVTSKYIREQIIRSE